ncbi:hypothetical protein E6C60_1420 [Paenibacillus algicola]|uniref:Uncharacterized protein n=1 Tax=Paenibacillus algicola TaxID=2565926 RepID=A0A4P8XHW2_9BACL|nr:hypothetical protein E6C60_1420 [Paenibacillus algicola]
MSGKPPWSDKMRECKKKLFPSGFHNPQETAPLFYSDIK